MPDKARSSSKYSELVDRIAKLENDIRSQQSRDLSDDQVRILEKRIANLESASRAEHSQDHLHTDSDAAGLRHCAMPPVRPRAFSADVSPDRVRLIEMVSKKWVNGTRLRYAFMPDSSPIGGTAQKALVREGFERWRNVGIGIQFDEVPGIAGADIRVGFVEGDGA